MLKNELTMPAILSFIKGSFVFPTFCRDWKRNSGMKVTITMLEAMPSRLMPMHTHHSSWGRRRKGEEPRNMFDKPIKRTPMNSTYYLLILRQSYGVTKLIPQYEKALIANMYPMLS